MNDLDMFEKFLENEDKKDKVKKILIDRQIYMAYKGKKNKNRKKLEVSNEG